MAVRTMPNDLDAEKSVLGSCLLSKYALQKACESLSSDKFYDEKNAKIFTILEKMQEDKTPLDLVTLTSRLQNEKILNEVGGVEYLNEIVNFVPVASNIDYYIKLVEEKAILRNLIITATDIASEGYNESESQIKALEYCMSHFDIYFKEVTCDARRGNGYVLRR